MNSQLKHIENQIPNLQAMPPNSYNHSLEDELIKKKIMLGFRVKFLNITSRDVRRNGSPKVIETLLFSTLLLPEEGNIELILFQDGQGNFVSSNDKIANSFITYFMNLFSSNLQEKHDHHDVATAHNISNGNLLAIPSKEDIHAILKSMRKDAAPGPVGLNVAFYKATWSWIGDDVYNLVKSFGLEV